MFHVCPGMQVERLYVGHPSHQRNSIKKSKKPMKSFKEPHNKKRRRTSENAEMTQHRETHRGPEKHREAQRSTERHREAQRGTEKHGEAQRSLEKHRKTQRSTEKHREAQRRTEKDNKKYNVKLDEECLTDL